MDYIKENLDLVKNNIVKTCYNIKKNPDDIKLIAVTKTISIDKINEIYKLNVKDFGENRVQELMQKTDYFDEFINWHLIGHLQTNKVKYIIDKAVMIHSVDSVKLAEEINKRATEHNKIMDILIEINIASEDSKFGIKPQSLTDFLIQIENLQNISVKGLMTVAPFVYDPNDNRKYFKKMNDLFQEAKKLNLLNNNFLYLSMGMSNDYMVAIEEGANIVRIGTSLFGKRN